MCGRIDAIVLGGNTPEGLQEVANFGHGLHPCVIGCSWPCSTTSVAGTFATKAIAARDAESSPSMCRAISVAPLSIARSTALRASSSSSGSRIRRWIVLCHPGVRPTSHAVGRGRQSPRGRRRWPRGSVVSGGQASPQLLQRSSENPRDLHLRDADALGYLGLGQAVEESQRHDGALIFAESRKESLDGFGVLDVGQRGI